MSELPRPSTLPISDDDWARTPTNVQTIIVTLLEQNSAKPSPRFYIPQMPKGSLRYIGLIAVAVLLFVILLASLLPREACIAHNTVYTVKSGDTLIGLSRQFDIPVTAIAQINGIQDINLLNIGQRLIIPRKFCAPAAMITQTLAVQASGTAFVLTFPPTPTITWTPSLTPDLTRTTATPTPTIDPIFLTATYIIHSATETDAVLQTATMTTWTPSLTPDLTRTTATPTPTVDGIFLTATFIVRSATETESAFQTATPAKICK